MSDNSPEIEIKIIDNLTVNGNTDLTEIAEKTSEFLISVLKESNESSHPYDQEELDILCKNRSPENILQVIESSYLVYAESEGKIIGVRMIVKENSEETEKYIPRFFYISSEYRKGTNLAIMLSIPIAKKLRELGVESYEFEALNFPETIEFYRSLPNIEEVGPTESGKFIIFRKHIKWFK